LANSADRFKEPQERVEVPRPTNRKAARTARDGDRRTHAREDTVRHITIITLTAAAAAMLTACGPQGTAPAPQVRELNRAEQASVDQAEQLIIQRCMAQRGYRYWVQPALDAEESMAFRQHVVLDDVGWARKHGYGGLIKQRVLAAKKYDPNLAYRNSLPPATRTRYITALGGGTSARIISARLPGGGQIRKAVGGCTGEADKQLYGDVDAWFHANKIATDLSPLYVPKLIRDQRYTGALGAWSACMRRSTGRLYGDPGDIQRDLAKRTAAMSAAKAHPAEVRLAVAEATCARAAALPDTIHRLALIYSEPVRRRYAKEITTHNRLQLAALQQAEKIIGHS
jgi:hypothetical protein